MSDFRTAVDERDLAALAGLLAEDVVLRSPVAYRPYQGKAMTMAILAAVSEVFEDLRYVRELHDEDGDALVFEARLGELDLMGCDFLSYDAEGRISELTVMVRPLRAAQELAARMAEHYARIQAQTGR